MGKIAVTFAIVMCTLFLVVSCDILNSLIGDGDTSGGGGPADNLTNIGDCRDGTSLEINQRCDLSGGSYYSQFEGSCCVQNRTGNRISRFCTSSQTMTSNLVLRKIGDRCVINEASCSGRVTIPVGFTRAQGESIIITTGNISRFSFAQGSCSSGDTCRPRSLPATILNSVCELTGGCITTRSGSITFNNGVCR